MVMERKNVSIHEAILKVNGAVNEFYRLNKDFSLEKNERGKGNKNMLEMWIKLEEWWLKMKCDGDLDLKTKVAGSSVFIRDSDEAVVDGICRKMMVDRALMAETLVFKDGIGWLLRKNGSVLF